MQSSQKSPCTERKAIMFRLDCKLRIETRAKLIRGYGAFKDKMPL